MESSTKTPNGFCLLKPGFEKYEKELDSALSNGGWKVIDKKKYRFTPDAAAALYVSHKDQPWFNDLCKYMTSGDCVCYSCYKSCSDPCGELKTIKHDFRDKYGVNDMKNCMHSSDNPDAVSTETQIINEKCVCCESIGDMTPEEWYELHPDDDNFAQSFKLGKYSLNVVTNPEISITDALQVALAEEYLAYYAYSIVAPFVYGKERSSIVDKLKEFAKDELEDHAAWILERLNQLGVTPDYILHPTNLNAIATHKYIYPERFDVVSILNANILAEEGAIETYTILEALTRNVDVITHEGVKHILIDEVEHLTELKDLLKDVCGCEPCAAEAGCE